MRSFHFLSANVAVSMSHTDAMALMIRQIIRYSYYFIREVCGSNPYISTWLRYSGFIVLYPIGVASEISCCVMAVPLLWVSSSFRFHIRFHQKSERPRRANS